MSHLRHRHAACAVVLLLACAPAWSDRSRLGEEAETIERGDCEVEAAVETSRQRGAPRRRGRSFEVACGIGWASELVLGWHKLREAEARESALGVELKTEVWPRRDGGIGWTLVASARRERESGRPARWAEQGLAVEAVYQHSDDWRVQASIGTRNNRIERRNSTPWELGFERALHENWELRVELAGEERRHQDWALALRWQVWPEHALLTMAHGAATRAPRERRRTLALTWEF